MESLRKKLLSLLSKDQIKTLKNLYFCFRSFFGSKRRIRGSKNYIYCPKVIFKKVLFQINGNDNEITIGNYARISNTNFYIEGSGHQVIIGENVILDGVDLAFEDHGCKIVIGDQTVMYHHTHIAAVEPYSVVQIGSDCLFSSYVDIRTTDSHSIIDLDTKKRINYGKNVIIKDHVWLGTDVTVLKGVAIDHDSVVGMKSLVTRDIPCNCVAGGVPAKILKQNITWQPERIY
jgi:acetyltransferase-like isoleucine patch superfamily enzyme